MINALCWFLNKTKTKPPHNSNRPNSSTILFSSLLSSPLLSSIPSPSSPSSSSSSTLPVVVAAAAVVFMASMQTEQIKRLRDIFARFDMDSDGSLTHLELAALLRSLGMKLSGDQIHLIMTNMDANDNGSVEFEELVEAILPEMSQDTVVDQEQLLEVFESFDRDGNGYITAVELAQSMAKMGHPLSFRELTEMFREADTDGDGTISFREFASVMAKSASEFLGLQIS